MEIPEGYANVRFIFTADGVVDPMSFAIGVFPEVGGSATEIADTAGDAFIAAGLGTTTRLIQGWTWVGTQATLTVGGEPVVGEDTQNMAGTAGGESIMVNTALLVRKATAFGGRKNRGRMFIPPFFIEESAVLTSGVIETATFAPIAGLINDFYDQLVVNELTPTLFHTDPVDLPTPITAFVAQNLMATQRRRMR